MTETTLRVRLGELSTIRIVCERNGCGGAVEVPIAKLASLSGATECPLCREPFLGEAAAQNHFASLARLIDRLGEHPFAVEFPIRLDGRAAGGSP